MYKPKDVPCVDAVEVGNSDDKTSRFLFGNEHV